MDHTTQLKLKTREKPLLLSPRGALGDELPPATLVCDGTGAHGKVPGADVEDQLGVLSVPGDAVWQALACGCDNTPTKNPAVVAGAGAGATLHTVNVLGIHDLRTTVELPRCELAVQVVGAVLHEQAESSTALLLVDALRVAGKEAHLDAGEVKNEGSSWPASKVAVQHVSRLQGPNLLAVAFCRGNKSTRSN